MKIAAFSSSDYTIEFLKSVNKYFNLVLIITRPDKPVGRKKSLSKSLPKRFARSNNIECLTPRNKNELKGLESAFFKKKPDFAVIADYGLIIPKNIFSIPKYKTLNIHFSLLPKLRGSSPVQYTILLGKRKAGITIFIANEKLDEGDIIWQKEVSLNGKETTPYLYKKLFNMLSLDFPDIIDKYTKGLLKPQKQDHHKATYTRRLTREDGFIPANILKNAMKGVFPSEKDLEKWPLYKDVSGRMSNVKCQMLNVIESAYRAFTPWPGLWTKIMIEDKKIKDKSTKRLKILKCHLEHPKPYPLDRKAYLVLDKVQLEGKTPVPFKQFKQAYQGRSSILLL